MQTDDATLDGLIHAVGFHNNKVNTRPPSVLTMPCSPQRPALPPPHQVKYIKAASLILKEQHGDRAPSTMGTLTLTPALTLTPTPASAPALTPTRRPQP